MIEQTPSASATQGIARMTATGTTGAGKGHAARGGLFAALLALLSARHDGKTGNIMPGHSIRSEGNASIAQNALAARPAPSQAGSRTANARERGAPGKTLPTGNTTHANERENTQDRNHADPATMPAVATALLPQAAHPARSPERISQTNQTFGFADATTESRKNMRSDHLAHPVNAFASARLHPANPDNGHASRNIASLSEKPATETPAEHGMKQTTRRTGPSRRNILDAAPSKDSPSINATGAASLASTERGTNGRQALDELLRGMEVRNGPVAESVRQPADRAREDRPSLFASERITQGGQKLKERPQMENAAPHGRTASVPTGHDAPHADARPAPEIPGAPEQSWQTRNQTPRTQAARLHEQGQNAFFQSSHAPVAGFRAPSTHASTPAAAESAMNAGDASPTAHATAQPALQSATTASDAPPAPAPAHDGPSRMFGPMRALEAVQQIAHSAAQGQTRLDIQLEPAHLGKVHVSLQTDAAKQLVVHITAEQPAAQQAIQQHLPQLRMALESQGMQPGGFSLNAGMGGDGQGQWQGAWQDGQDSSGFGGRHDGPAVAPAAANHETTAAPRRASGRLSIHV